MKKSYIFVLIGLLLMLASATVFAGGVYVQFNHSDPLWVQKGQPAHIVVQYGNQTGEAMEDVRVKCQFLGQGFNERFHPRTTAHQFDVTLGNNAKQATTEWFDIINGQNYNMQLVVVPPDFDDIRIRCRYQQLVDGKIETLQGEQIRLKIRN